jgi:rare lipoprotein A
MSARPLTLALVVLAASLAACSSTPPLAPASTHGSVIDAPRSSRGNPTNYEVFGRRYFVMDTSDGYRATGVASWYGRDFHGKSTSSGEPYDMFAMTAAHKTLPLPTWVEVTNQRNGKSVIVKVNDRGPFVDDRIIDLSYAAAIALDMIGTGTAPVFVRALGAPAAPLTTVTQAPEPVAPPAAATRVASNIPAAESATALGARVFAQIGAFGDYANASRMLGRLRAAGIANTAIVTAGAADGASVHRVRVGPLRDEAEYRRIDSELRRRGFDPSHMVVERVSE